MLKNFILSPCMVVSLIVMLGSAGCTQPSKPIQVLMIAGGIAHDYESLPEMLARRLIERGDMNVDITTDLNDLNPSNINRYDVLLFNTCHQDRLDDVSRRAIVEHIQSGKGLVSTHCSLWSYQDWPE